METRIAARPRPPAHPSDTDSPGDASPDRYSALIKRLASGVYLVRLEAEGVVHATQKVLLLR